jgi:Uncharacterized protein conserved in bacteria (DUF2252)
VAALSLACVAAACSSGSDSDATSTSSSAPTTSVPTSTTSRAPTTTTATTTSSTSTSTHFADIARKVVGVGSVGTRAWVVLMLGRDNDDPLLLQFKEAQPSVLEPYLGASSFGHHGRRVVEGQRLMQAATDVLLGWQRTTGLDGVQRDFYSGSCGTGRARLSSS